MDLMTTDIIVLAAAPPMLAACISDVRRRIIPDWAAAAVLVTGLAAALAQGPELLPGALLGMGAGLLVGAAAAIFGAWGWGDAKLLMATGAVAGIAAFAPLLVGTAIAGGVMAAVLLLLRPPVLAGRLALPAKAPRWLRAEQTRLRRAPTLPYGVAIAAGLLLAMAARP